MRPRDPWESELDYYHRMRMARLKHEMYYEKQRLHRGMGIPGFLHPSVMEFPSLPFTDTTEKENKRKKLILLL